MMQINHVLKVAVLVVGMLCLSACSSTKKPGDGMNGPQASGLGSGEGGFGDSASSNANRLKAPYDQIYYFDFNKYDIAQDDIASVNVQANYLASHSSAKVRLEGNADERGSREYNIALGWKRAKALAAILEQQGVSASQIAMVSYGKEKPAAFGHDESSYHLNRRAALVYEAK